MKKENMTLEKKVKTLKQKLKKIKICTNEIIMYADVENK